MERKNNDFSNYTMEFRVSQQGLILLNRGQQIENIRTLETTTWDGQFRKQSLRLKKIKSNWLDFANSAAVKQLEEAYEAYCHAEAHHFIARNHITGLHCDQDTYYGNEFKKRQFNLQVMEKNLDYCEYHVVINLRKHDYAIMIQSMVRNNHARKKVKVEAPPLAPVFKQVPMQIEEPCCYYYSNCLAPLQ